MPNIIDRFELLKNVIRISNSPVDIERRLKNLLILLKRELVVDGVYLFHYDQNSRQLSLRSSGDVDDDPELILELTDNFLARVVKGRRRVMADPSDLGGIGGAAAGLFEGYMSGEAVPITDDRLLYGVLMILSRTPRDMSREVAELLDTIAREMAGTLRNARLTAESKKRIADLSVLYEVGLALSSTIDLDQMLKTIVNITCNVLRAQGCSINVMDQSLNRLLLTSEFGDIPNSYHFKPPFHSPLHDLPLAFRTAIIEKRPVIGAIGPVEEEKTGQVPSLTCFPIAFKSGFCGCLCVFRSWPVSRKGELQYNPEHLELLNTMGAMISSSIENALTFRNVNQLAHDNEQLVGSLSRLYEISGAMMTTVKTEELLTIITNALILEQGLGFDRALILLMSEEEDCLLGAAFQEVAPGERTAQTGTLNELLDQCPPASMLHGTVENDYLNLKFCLENYRGALVRCVMEKKTFLIDPEGDLPLADPPLPHEFGNMYGIVAPMLAKGKVVGVIAVDRNFTREPATDGDIRNLTMLANQAGLAIENSRLYEYIEQAKRTLSQTRERLLEAEKLAALGEMAAGMAHEIRNPLVSIGGFTRRLLKKAGDNPQQRFYVDVIVKEVARLEKILGEILNFSHDTLGHLEERNLNDMVTDSLYILRRDFKDANITIEKNLSENLPSIVVDDRQIKHVFFNIFYNASQAMPEGGRLSIKTYATKLHDQEFAACEISDTGPGIPQDVLPNIFNPFFTTKDVGPGLGLSIVHKIIQRHHGEIDVVNRLDVPGAIFVIRIPVAPQPGLYLK